MKENEKTLRALSLIAAELHIQNHIKITVARGISIDKSFATEIVIEKLAENFRAYFEGDKFSSESVVKLRVATER